jgi:hypothetical protein
MLFYMYIIIFKQKITGFENLTNLNLSKTKVTIGGLRELFADCAFAKKLEILDLSYCAGVNGRTVFLDLQRKYYFKFLICFSGIVD